MKPKTLKERGQALIVIALAAIGLFAIVGLAIDGSAKFSDRRHAQNAADTAALAGSLSLVNGKTTVVNGSWQQWQVDALQRALDNGYDRNHVTNEVWVYKCSAPLTDPARTGSPVDCGPYNSQESYIQVVIVSRVNTFFARVIGINQTVNTVNAVTLWTKKGPVYPGMTFLQYKPQGTGCPGEFIVGGSGTVVVDGGGIYVNSNNTGGTNPSGGNCGAFTQAGCNTSLKVINGGGISSVGEISTDPCNGVDLIEATETEGVPALPFPPDALAPPPECNMNYGIVQNDSATDISTIWPGKYDSLPPQAASQKTVIMKPGNYCVFETVKVASAQDTLKGQDVFIYVKYNSQKAVPVGIQGGTVQIDAPDTGDYQGYLIYVDPGPIVSGAYVGSPKNCNINGATDDYFTGTILAPYCEFTINGGGNPTGFQAQLIAYTVKLDGNNTLTFKYDSSKIATNQSKVGMMR